MPIIYEAGSVHMDQHIFDQWSVSHAIWGFVLGWAYTAPVAAWRVGLLFVLWELWENVVEVAFSTYSPGEYHGDSFVNSFFDMVPSVTGVLLGRHAPRAWPLVALAELIAIGQHFAAVLLVLLIVPQITFQDIWLLRDPVAFDVKYQASAQPFLVLGMLVTALAIGHSPLTQVM